MSAPPHSPQNFRPGSFAVLQAGQTVANAAPHSPQNFTPAEFSEPQLKQRDIVDAPPGEGTTSSSTALTKPYIRGPTDLACGDDTRLVVIGSEGVT